MLAASAHLPFSDVCSTVSCWALIFSVIFPPVHVLGYEIISTVPPSAAHHHRQGHGHAHPHPHGHHRLFSAPAYSLTVYLDSTLKRFSDSNPESCLSLPMSMPISPPCGPTSLSEECYLLRCPTGFTPSRHSSSANPRRSKKPHLHKSKAMLHQQQHKENQHPYHHHRRNTLGTAQQQAQKSQNDISVSSDLSSSVDLASSAQQDTPQASSQNSPREARGLRDMAAGNIKRVSVTRKNDRRRHQGSWARLTKRSLRRLTCDHSHWPSFMDAFWSKDPQSDHSCPAHDRTDDEDKDKDKDKDGDDSGNDNDDDSKLLWQGLVHIPDMYALKSSKDYLPMTGSLLHFPQPFTLPSVLHRPWLALIPCTVQSMDELIAATELGATAAIVYPTEQDLDECVSSLLRKEGYLANVTKSLAPVFTLDYQTTHPLALLLDNLGDDSVASATLALVDVPPSPYAKPAPSALSKVEDPRSEQHIAVETADDGHVQETPSCQAGFLTNSFKSGAVVIRKALVQVGLDALSRARKGPLLRPHHNHPATKVDVQKEGRGMVSTSSPPLYTASPARQNIVTATTLKDNDLHDLGAEIRPVIPATMTKTLRSDQFVKKEVQTEHVFVHRYGLQSATLRIVHRFYSFSPSKFMQDMAILVRDDSMTGKLAMVLMSTICGVGVGMFGALLFVVALKVRLFQTRHRGQHQESNSHQMTAQQQQQTHQQMMQHGYKRVIPPGMLDSFGVQTVLQTSTSTIMMTTTAAKMDMAAFTKIKLGYAESVIEMEEGLEDVVARENARRQRLRTRSGHLFANATESNADADAEVNEERDTDVGANATEWDGSFEGDEMDEVLDPSLAENTTLLLSQGVSETATMDMERITAAIMNATHRGSYRRASHSRPGPQVELNPTSMTTSFSSSLSLSLSSPLSAESSPDEKHRTCAVGEEEEDGGKEKKKLPFANANAQTMCSICLGEYEVGDQVRTLPCYHQFHMSCIDPWLLSIASLCPICKRDLLPGSP